MCITFKIKNYPQEAEMKELVMETAEEEHLKVVIVTIVAIVTETVVTTKLNSAETNRLPET